MIVTTIAGVVVISSRLVNDRAWRSDICGYVRGAVEGLGYDRGQQVGLLKGGVYYSKLNKSMIVILRSICGKVRSELLL